MGTRLVCVGDSFTEGVADEFRPDGHYRGWADRVAQRLADHEALQDRTVEYANLAVRGKLLDQIVDEQAGRALALEPTLITFHAGGNDVLRPGTDLADLFSRYDTTVARLADSGAQVFVFTALTRAGGRGRLADRVAERLERFNDNARTVAEVHACTLVDLDAVTAFRDRRLWDADRLHLNAVGHERVAAVVLSAIGVTDEKTLGGPDGWWLKHLPSVRTPRAKEVVRTLDWAGRHLVPWIIRRLRGVSSGDGITAKNPELATLGPHRGVRTAR